MRELDTEVDLRDCPIQSQNFSVSPFRIDNVRKDAPLCQALYP